MSITIEKSRETRQEEEENRVGQGVRDLAEDIACFLAYSEEPRTLGEIREHLSGDEDYFEDDLEYVSDALRYLEDEARIGPDFRMEDGVLDNNAYSFRDYTT